MNESKINTPGPRIRTAPIIKIARYNVYFAIISIPLYIPVDAARVKENVVTTSTISLVAKTSGIPHKDCSE